MDCLPSSNEWSQRTRWEFAKEHIDALRWHLEALEKALAQGGAPALINERQHLPELCQRGVEAHALLEQLATLPLEQRQGLS
jgi:hypothetical protein